MKKQINNKTTLYKHRQNVMRFQCINSKIYFYNPANVLLTEYHTDNCVCAVLNRLLKAMSWQYSNVYIWDAYGNYRRSTVVKRGLTDRNRCRGHWIMLDDISETEQYCHSQMSSTWSLESRQYIIIAVVAWVWTILMECRVSSSCVWCALCRGRYWCCCYSVRTTTILSVLIIYAFSMKQSIEFPRAMCVWTFSFFFLGNCMHETILGKKCRLKKSVLYR